MSLLALRVRLPAATCLSFALVLAEPTGAATPGETQADTDAYWRVALSPGMVHFNPSDEHEWVWALGVERQRVDGWLWGAAYFSNSFGQPSGYVYAGQRYAGLWQRPPLYFQWTAGLLYGYRGEYEGKVPLNHNGFSPGAVFSLGWQFDRHYSAQLNLLGDAGLMLQLSYDWR